MLTPATCFTALRAAEFSRLDETDTVYLDYTGRRCTPSRWFAVTPSG
jgi:hypothetical protein